MDSDALRSEVDEWLRDGIITEAQAEAILARYDDGDESRRSRAVLALLAVGAALVFVGITLFLATNWRDLQIAVRVGVLLAAPGLAYIGGALAYVRAVPRAGLVLSLLGAVLVGPSAFLLADLAEPTIAGTWILLLWAAVALSTGHALASRVGTGFGLLLLAPLVVDLVSPDNPIVPIAFLGLALFALASVQNDALAWTYRGVGTALSLLGLVVMTTLDGQYDRFDPGTSATLITLVIAAVGGTGWHGIRRKRLTFGWLAVAIAGLAVGTGLAFGAPEPVPDAVAFVLIHLVVLAVTASTGYYGYRSGSRRFIDFAAGVALIQTLSFVEATIVDALSGSIALVVAGIVLIVAAVGLERGRRSIHSRLGA